MASFNKVILMGNLTRDPELRKTNTDLSICKIGLAVNRRYTDRDGNAKEEVTYVDVDAFGKTADIIAQYMTKGRPILIEGRLRLDQWETPQGEKRSKMAVVCETFQFVGSRDGGEGGGGGGGYSETTPPQTRRTGSGDGDSGDSFEDDKDVPF